MKAFPIILTFVAILGCSKTEFSGSSDFELEQMARAATEGVVNELENFYKLNGKYPEELTQLIPNQISKLPVLNEDTKIYYQAINGNKSYRLYAYVPIIVALGDRCVRRIEYRQNKDYIREENLNLIKIIKEWALYEQCRKYD